MLDHARELSKQNKVVYVIAVTEEHAETLRWQLGDGPHGIKVESALDINNLDWQTLTLRGAHPNCVVLVDHYAIEHRFAKVLEMLERYDQP